MHCTLYYVVNGEDYEDAQNVLEHRLDEDGTEENWYTLIGVIKQEGLNLKVLNKCTYTDKDFTIENIVTKVNEDLPSSDEPIDEVDLWDADVNPGIWDVQSLTNECTDFDEDKYLFIVNIHT